MKKMMRAAVWHGRRDVRIEERPIPEPKVGEVIVAVSWAGICGTDRHEYFGPVFIPVTKPHRLTGCTAPLIMGHEFSGLISAAGAGVSGWKEGARVMANGTLSCGVCKPCREGRYNICDKLGFLGVSCDGAFAEYVAVSAERLFEIPPLVSLRHAPLAEPLACGIHAVKLLGDIRGKCAVIIGPGIIGLSCFFAALEAGAKAALVLGVGTERKALVEKSGGFYADITKQDPLEAALALLGGKADICFECVGAQTALDTGVRLLAGGGSLMIMGVYEKPPIFPMNDFQEGERRLFTSQAHVDEIAAALSLLAAGKINADALITAELTLDTLASGGFEDAARHPNKHIKALVKIGGETEHPV
ncbi:MAG: alcohol dehydrogenase catalytic domain-containing protein [Spirochaetaceae bacterium]|jgi:(R,R)-butanediol dehydrogenase/meso-butanediol dehydrogenase/diacetyl reductase|nr:alcohol dehydrogenase catalytic domain-containing protein [Spirochaetaceae bacterium]